MNALGHYEELARDLGLRAVADLPLAQHTTLRVGGPADWGFFPRDPEQAAALYGELAGGDLPVKILGGGSNLLISDAGVRAAVIVTSEMNARPVRLPGSRVFAPAGAAIPGLARWSAKQGLAGLEFAEGIPALLGGALRMNAGANASCFAEVIEYLLLAGDDGGVHEYSPQPGDFAYRESFIGRDGRLVLGAMLALEEEDPDEIKQRITAYRDRRRKSQPLTERSAGCVFANLPEQPIGALVDQLGLKGLAIGGAEVSTKHGNFIINRGGARASEIRELIDRLREQILRATGTTPRLEIEIWEEAE